MPFAVFYGRKLFLILSPAARWVAASVVAVARLGRWLLVGIDDVGGAGDSDFLRLLLLGELLGEFLAYLGLDVPLEHVGGEHVFLGHLLAAELVGMCLHVGVADAARALGRERHEHAVAGVELHAVVLLDLVEDDAGGYFQDGFYLEVAGDAALDVHLVGEFGGGDGVVYYGLAAP